MSEARIGRRPAQPADTSRDASQPQPAHQFPRVRLVAEPKSGEAGVARQSEEHRPAGIPTVVALPYVTSLLNRGISIRPHGILASAQAIAGQKETPQHETKKEPPVPPTVSSPRSSSRRFAPDPRFDRSGRIDPRKVPRWAVPQVMSPNEHARTLHTLKHMPGPGGGKNYIGEGDRFVSPFDPRPRVYGPGLNHPIGVMHWSGGGPNNGGMKVPNIPGGGGGGR